MTVTNVLYHLKTQILCPLWMWLLVFKVSAIWWQVQWRRSALCRCAAVPGLQKFVPEQQLREFSPENWTMARTWQEQNLGIPRYLWSVQRQEGLQNEPYMNLISSCITLSSFLTWSECSQVVLMCPSPSVTYARLWGLQIGSQFAGLAFLHFEVGLPILRRHINVEIYDMRSHLRLSSFPHGELTQCASNCLSSFANFWFCACDSCRSNMEWNSKNVSNKTVALSCSQLSNSLKIIDYHQSVFVHQSASSRPLV